MGRVLIVAGVLLALLGVALSLAPKVPWLGRLPGDIVIERGTVRFYAPLATCLLLSAALSAVFWLVRKILG